MTSVCEHLALSSELMSCVNSEVSVGSHSLSHSSHVPNKTYGFCGGRTPWKDEVSELGRSCVKVKVAVLGSPSLIVLMVCVDVKHHERKKEDKHLAVLFMF